MTYFIRTENGVAANVSKAAGLAEANKCMMDGKRDVAEMTATSGFYMIWYKDGRKVTLSRQDGEMPQSADDPQEWTGTHSRGNHLHRFDRETLKARCNSRIRPRRWPSGYAFQTRAEVESGEYADLYTFCPACESK